MSLDAALLAELAALAHDEGLMRLSAVRLDHPGFVPAQAELDRFLDEGRQGEMDFLARTRELRKDPAPMLPGAKTVVMVAVPYRGQAGPVARYAQSADYHSVMFRRLDRLATHLQARLPDEQSLVCVDTKPLLERAAAALAGLGFVGKHGCVIVPGLGSYVLLGALLTTAALTKPDTVTDLHKAMWDACGQCTRCLDACPTDAFDAPGRLDPRRCISYLTIEHRGPIEPELADAMGERVAGCDVCQEVCPYNGGRERDSRVPEVAWLEPPVGPPRDAELTTLANIRSARYRAFVKDTALRRIPRRAMRRNALLALGNRPGPLADEERQALEHAAADDEPQVSAAAKRALERRG
ncbi:MAG: tRNA epoxyqueuosine(34) reductase QueG [Myxococcota bacterium]